jgi:hypothetical protein
VSGSACAETTSNNEWASGCEHREHRDGQVEEASPFEVLLVRNRALSPIASSSTTAEPTRPSGRLSGTDTRPVFFVDHSGVHAALA